MFFQKLLYNFFRKNPKKMLQNNKQLSARLAEIYQMLSNVQELGDAVMFSTDIDNNIKCVFFDLVRNETSKYKRRTWWNNFYSFVLVGFFGVFFLGDGIKNLRSIQKNLFFCFTQDIGTFVNIRTDIVKRERRTKKNIFMKD